MPLTESGKWRKASTLAIPTRIRLLTFFTDREFHVLRQERDQLEKLVLSKDEGDMFSTKFGKCLAGKNRF